MKIEKFLLLAAVSSVCIGFTAIGQDSEAPASDYPDVGMIPNSNMLHIGIVVRDIEAAPFPVVSLLIRTIFVGFFLDFDATVAFSGPGWIECSCPRRFGRDELPTLLSKDPVMSP